MKKLFLIIAVVCSALVLSSCNKEDVSLPIENKNLVGTWCLVQRTEDGKTIDVTPSSYDQYEEMVFTETSYVTKTWNGEWNQDKGEYVFDLEPNATVKVGYYEIKDGAIWVSTYKVAIIKQLTSTELALEYNPAETDWYRKKSVASN